MLKTPEEYFADQCLAVPQDADTTLSPAEKAFVQKYLGSETLNGMPVLDPEQALPGLALTPDAAVAARGEERQEKAFVQKYLGSETLSGMNGLTT